MRMLPDGVGSQGPWRCMVDSSTPNATRLGLVDMATRDDQSMAEIRSLGQLMAPDERTLHFVPVGFSPAEALTPEYAAEFQQQAIAHCDLHPDVPEWTRRSFERLRTLHTYGVLCYETYTAAHDLAWLALEQALRDRFVAYYSGTVPLVNPKTGEEKPITARDFTVIDTAFRRGGSHVRGEWQLHVKAGEPLAFRGSMTQLLEWARREGLLEGQRNRWLDSVLVEMRNAVAHPSDHLVMPPDSARTIADLAEIVNRLWGHPTPGGRLYPAPLERQILVVAWTEREGALSVTVVRRHQLDSSRELDSWACVVLRGVFNDPDLTQFDARFERTSYPAELLFGPASFARAREWVERADPQPDTIKHLDRLFVLRTYDGKVSLPRRPEAALGVPEDRRVGQWYIIRADYPNDAFAHVRHINRGVECVDGRRPGNRPAEDASGISTPCPVEEVFVGTWEQMAQSLADRILRAEHPGDPPARIPSRIDFALIPDLEAD